MRLVKANRHVRYPKQHMERSLSPKGEQELHSSSSLKSIPWTKKLQCFKREKLNLQDEKPKDITFYQPSNFLQSQVQNDIHSP